MADWGTKIQRAMDARAGRIALSQKDMQRRLADLEIEVSRLKLLSPYTNKQPGCFCHCHNPLAQQNFAPGWDNWGFPATGTG